MRLFKCAILRVVRPANGKIGRRRSGKKESDGENRVKKKVSRPSDVGSISKGSDPNALQSIIAKLMRGGSDWGNLMKRERERGKTRGTKASNETLYQLHRGKSASYGSAREKRGRRFSQSNTHMGSRFLSASPHGVRLKIKQK